MTSILTVTRSRDDRVIAGVCAGIAERFGWRPFDVRVVFLVSCLLPGPQFVLYLLLWLLMPSREDGAAPPPYEVGKQPGGSGSR